jgi:hypothetical protein
MSNCDAQHADDYLRSSELVSKRTRTPLEVGVVRQILHRTLILRRSDLGRLPMDFPHRCLSLLGAAFPSMRVHQITGRRRSWYPAGGRRAQASTNRLRGTLPVPAVAPPIGGCSCTQPAAISANAIAAIKASGFMRSPDGKAYQRGS